MDTNEPRWPLISLVSFRAHSWLMVLFSVFLSVRWSAPVGLEFQSGKPWLGYFFAQSRICNFAALGVTHVGGNLGATINSPRP